MNDGKVKLFDMKPTPPDYGYYAIKRGSTVRTIRPIVFGDGKRLEIGTVGLVRRTGTRCVVDFAQFTRRVDRDALELVQRSE